MRNQSKDTEVQVEGKNCTGNKLNQQACVRKTAEQRLDEMGNMGGGMNTAGLVTGMMMGGAVGNQMGGMMNNINKTPPPLSTVLYHIALNGQQGGSFSIEQLQDLAKNGKFTKAHHNRKEGMTAWNLASNIPELSKVFAVVPQPPPQPTPNP